jgi:hypothetical protein
MATQAKWPGKAPEEGTHEAETADICAEGKMADLKLGSHPKFHAHVLPTLWDLAKSLFCPEPQCPHP